MLARASTTCCFCSARFRRRSIANGVGVRWFDSNGLGLLSSEVDAVSSSKSAQEGNWSCDEAELISFLCTVDSALSRLCVCMSQVTRCTAPASVTMTSRRGMLRNTRGC